MRSLKILTVILLLASFGLQAQSRDEFQGKSPSTDIAKLVSIYPNPAIDYINVHFHKSKAQDVTVTLHNIIGNEIRVEMEAIDDHEVRLHVKELSAGYYLLVIKDHVTHSQGVIKVVKR